MLTNHLQNQVDPGKSSSPVRSLQGSTRSYHGLQNSQATAQNLYGSSRSLQGSARIPANKQAQGKIKCLTKHYFKKIVYCQIEATPAENTKLFIYFLFLIP